MSVQDLKDLILGWIPDNVMRLISPQRARNAYYSIIDFFWDVTGDKSDLETSDKTNLVNAINELKQSVDGATGFNISEIILSNGQSFLFPPMSKGEAFVIRIFEYDGSSQEGIPSPNGVVWLGGYGGVGVGDGSMVICLVNNAGGTYNDVGHNFAIINQGKDAEVIFVDELPDENLARTGVIYVLNSNNAMYVWDSQLGDYVLIGDVIPGTLISSTVFEDENNNAVVPEANKLYFDTTTEIYYRWDGSSFVPISGGGSTSDDITNESDVTGATVTEALDELQEQIDVIIPFGGLTGDVTAGTNGVTTVEKLSEASAVGKNQSVVVLPDGTIQGEDLFELWVYDDTVRPYTLTDLQTKYPTAAGRLQGFEVRCRLLTPPTTYRKESYNDSVWIKIEGSNVV